MSEDINLWVTQCVACQASSVIIKKEVEYTPIQVNQPFELIGMDLIGPLKITSNNNQYICVLIDYVTKWPQAYPLKSKSAEEVSKCILKFFYQFEAPKRILTDQGKEFVNEINRNVCKILNIQRSLCAPYHPQTNGLVERMNGTIQRALSKLVNEKPEEWDKHLDPVMFGLRTKCHMTTKYSPFFLMFGREARYPTQIPDEYRVDSSVEDILSVEEATEEILKLDEVLQAAISNTKKTQSKYQNKNKGRPSPSFTVGMKVWRMNTRSQQRKGGKLDRNYLGPYTIAAISGKSVDLLDSKGVTIPKINIDHLMVFTEEQPRIPHKLSNASSSEPSTTTTSTVGPPTTTSASAPSTTTSASAPSTTTSASAPSTTTSASAPSTTTSASAPSTTTSASAPSTTTSASAPSTTTSDTNALSSAAMGMMHASTASVKSTVDPSIIKNVTDAWEGNKTYVLLSKIGPYKIFFDDIYNTAPQRELESEVINAYLTVLVNKFNQDSAEKAFVVDTYEMTRVWKRNKPKIKIDPVFYKYILGVVNEGHHWMLVVIKPGEKRSLFLDPLGESKRRVTQCQDISRFFMRHKGLNASRWACDTLPHPIQQDATSCGAYVLKFAECILKDVPVEFDNSASSIASLRQQIAICLLENTDDLTDLCHYCGNHDGDTEWIGCDICPRWYHRSCAKKPRKSTESKFVCEACWSDS
ncbi:uncharacterized protein LOC102075523 [Oreochromis niloticus]|uniref:uncharacterized protein LOC102075523 n=1 Tax=Oreochromis niloticus TaxID=8128 RepID=UPI00090508E1|nr:uncharacterized protein LOC102075523 [Oreochromis niloticus]